jgi:predicted transcriptional regulator
MNGGDPDMADHSKTHVSLMLPSATVAGFDRLAEALGQDAADVMRQALEQYLANTGAEALADAQGLNELDRGDSVELDDVLEKAQLIVDAAELRRRRAG